MWRRWLCASLVWCSALGALADEPEETALHWVRARGAERCIDPTSLAQRVEALTGPVFGRPADAERSLEGEIAPARRGFTVRIVSTSARGEKRGERTLASPDRDCRRLDAAIAFVLALTIDPALAQRGIPDEFLRLFGEEEPPEQSLLAELNAHPPAPLVLPDEPPAEAPPARPAEPPAPRPAEASAPPAPARSPRARYTAWVAGALLGRTLPRWMPGVEGVLEVDPRNAWPVALALRAFPVAREQPLAGDARGDFTAYALALSTCPLALGSRARLQGCVGADLAYLRGQGTRGFARNHTDALWDPAAELALRAHVHLARGVGLVGQAASRIRITSQRFTGREGTTTQTVLEPARVGITLSAGLSYAF